MHWADGPGDGVTTSSYAEEDLIMTGSCVGESRKLTGSMQERLVL